MSLTDQLNEHFRRVLLRRPRAWDCGRVALESLSLHHPDVATFMLGKFPTCANYRAGVAEFARRDIYSAADYCDEVVRESEGRMRHTHQPQPGDLAFTCSKMADGRGFPGMGVVVDARQCAFLCLRGRVDRVNLDTLHDFAGVV